MPTLKQIECCIALPPYHRVLDEIRSVYTDGCVETFVAIPDEPSAFNIHVSSEGFIAPGLAVFVFIDGVYQCMRFRADLIEEHPPYTTRDDTEIDFLFRQKEEKIQGERFLGREWRFDKLNIAATDAHANRSDEIGTIEVVVLRLHGMEAPKEILAMHPQYDGANDCSDQDPEEDSFGAGFDGPSDRRENDRQAAVPLSFIAPGSLTGTSSASPVVPVGGVGHGGSYYHMYRPQAGQIYPAPVMAEPAPRRRFRPSSDHQPGVMWRPEMDRVFTVAVSTVKESDSQLSEANRRPVQANERAHIASHDTKGKGDAQKSTEKPASEEQPATFDNVNVEQAGVWANEQKNDDNEGFDPNWQPAHGSDKDNEGEGVDSNWKPDHGSNKDNEVEKVAQNSHPDHGSKKAKSHKSSKPPSSVSYMHVPSVPEEPVIKSYWKNWNKRPVSQKYKLARYVEASRGFVTAPSELPEQVPEREAKKRGLKHQVYAGHGSEYRHRLGVPVYKDSMEKPYAVFRFRYRTKETLKKMLRDKDADWEKVRKREEQQKLMSMSKEELIEQLMKKSSISGKSSSVKQAARDTPGSTRSSLVSNWVQEVAQVSSSQNSEAKSKPSFAKMTCNPCGKEVADTDKWWHCETCDFDMCLPCVNGENWCKDSSHELEKWGGSTIDGKRELLRKTSSKHGGSQSGKAKSNSGGSQNGKLASHHSGSQGGKSRAGSQKEADKPAEANETWTTPPGFDDPNANEPANQW